MSGTTEGGYRPGLDGLRALAVAAVVLFHLDRLPGGNLGVDAFFVVSGWLITWRLLGEADRRGTIDVGSFWNGRIRRLAPASLTVLAAIAVVWSMAGITVASLQRDLLWAAGWVSNWGTISGGGDYWARFGEPSPVTHFWSLAIEEQFYLAWPLVILVACMFAPHRRATIGVVSCAGAVGSILVMNLMFDPADPTGTYMNTFARAHSLLIGATAAAGTIVLGDGRLRGGRLARRVAPGAALVVVTMVIITSHSSTWLFRWGFPLFALAMVAVVVAVADGGGCRVLASPPMRWVGDRSYGLYLWHWPVFLLLAPARFDVPTSVVSSAAFDAVRVGCAVVLADLSFRFVESPVRRMRVRVQWRGPAVAGSACCLLAVLVLTLVPRPTSRSEASVVTLPPTGAIAATEPAVPPGSEAAVPPGSEAAVPPGSEAAVPPGSEPVAEPAGEPIQPASSAPAAAEPQPGDPASMARPLRVLVGGDSTAVHLSEALLSYAATVPDQLTAGSASFPGCGLSAGSDGRLHEFTTTTGERELIDLGGCLVQWESIPLRVTAEAIDVVLVSIGPWDVVDIHLNGTLVSVADPVGLRLVQEAYVRFVDRVRSAGAAVVWITPADAQLGWGEFDDPINNPERWIAMRAIIDALDVVQVDLPGWLTARNLLGPEGRPDGVHLTPDLNARFVEEMVAPALAVLPVGMMQ